MVPIHNPLFKKSTANFPTVIITVSLRCRGLYPVAKPERITQCEGGNCTAQSLMKTDTFSLKTPRNFAIKLQVVPPGFEPRTHDYKSCPFTVYAYRTETADFPVTCRLPWLSVLPLTGIRVYSFPSALGWRDSNPRNDGVKVRCLTTWLHPNNMVPAGGLEPPLSPL